MKIKKKILFFVALICLFYCVSLMQATYAKYVTTADTDASFTIARWNILVNDQDIKENSNFTNLIVPTFDGTANIKEDVIAPTSEGYFDIVIDGTETDVSYTYTLTIDYAASNDVDDLIITKYTIGEVNYSYTIGNSISDDVLLNAEDKVTSIRFYVKWNDDPVTQTMDNGADTSATINGNAAFAVNLNVIQKR